MNWLQKISQKAMSLPHKHTVPIGHEYEGADKVDKIMLPDIAIKQEKDHPDMRYMNQGNMGLIYDNKQIDMGDHAIKYTTDYDEYIAAQRIHKNPMSCVVKVLLPPEAIQSDLYKITLEKVINLTTEQINNFENDENIAENYRSMERCLEENGYCTTDASPENIGYNSVGNMVILDLGAIEYC